MKSVIFKFSGLNPARRKGVWVLSKNGRGNRLKCCGDMSLNPKFRSPMDTRTAPAVSDSQAVSYERMKANANSIVKSKNFSKSLKLFPCGCIRIKI
ncbi:hypothetical protein Y032_0082g1522 [Ancylostoma ceylanicum]|nr:hypothetical protein Y032_0082g1522 [Ancylostoma ceylanicum]